MKILFFCLFNVTRNASGGIARVTGNLSNLFTENGHICSLAYFNDVPGQNDGSFRNVTKLTRHKEEQDLDRLASVNSVFIIQVQMNKANLYLLPVLASLKEKYGTRMIYCNHSVPFAEAAGYNGGYLKYLLFHSGLKAKERISEIIWCCTAILFPEKAIKRIARRSQSVTDNLDITVLLSESFIPKFRKYVKCRESQVTAIGNCFTFDERLPEKELEAKDKTVLVVSNMTEHAKRISTALRIWKKVSEKEYAKDWNLILVGDGKDLDYYRMTASRLQLENCQFVGRQNPLPYYRKARIQLLTSAFEGFGMVLLEAQQMGCVPVAFESSGSVHDIITDGENGVLVPSFDEKTFADRLYTLMTDPDLLTRLAHNCINRDERFSGKTIYSKWIGILSPDTGI